MKKIFALLLVVFVFSVGACGEKQPDSESTHTEDQQIIYNISDEMSAEEKLSVISGECIGFLQVKINPAMELYIAMDESLGEHVVRGGRPLNEEAKKLLRELSVSDVTLWDALYSIFHAAADCGYLREDSNVKIQYYGQLQEYDMEAVIRNIVNEYQREQSFSYDIACEELGVSSVNSDSDGSVIDEELYDTVEYDQDGNIIRTVMINSEANTVETCVYDKGGSLLSRTVESKNHGETFAEYYENNALIKTVVKHSWGTVTQNFDGSGSMISEITDDQERGAYSEDYYKDGILEKTYRRNTEYEQTQTFDSSGNVISSITDNKAEGSYSESYWTYYGDGSVASYTTSLTDSYYSQGYHKEEQYSQGGGVIMRYEVSQYGDNRYYYDGSGKPTRHEGKDSNGCRVETVFHSDGSRVTRVYEAGGKIRVETWGADGSLNVSYE